MPVLIIAVSLESAFSISELIPHVSHDRRSINSALKSQEDVRRSLIGDMMARMFAMDIEGLRNEEISFEKGVFGKPRLQQISEPWEYNLSYAEQWVVGIVGRKGQRVGIDIQKLSPVPPSLARYSMSTGEARQYEALPLDEQTTYFHELWTRKESYLKMEGIGISVPMHAVFPEEGAVNPVGIFRKYGTPKHYFQTYDIDPRYKLTACSTDFRFPETCLLVKAADVAEVFLRRCTEQLEGASLQGRSMPFLTTGQLLRQDSILPLQ